MMIWTSGSCASVVRAEEGQHQGRMHEACQWPTGRSSARSVQRRRPRGHAKKCMHDHENEPFRGVQAGARGDEEARAQRRLTACRQSRDRSPMPTIRKTLTRYRRGVLLWRRLCFRITVHYTDGSSATVQLAPEQLAPPARSYRWWLVVSGRKPDQIMAPSHDAGTRGKLQVNPTAQLDQAGVCLPTPRPGVRPGFAPSRAQAGRHSPDETSQSREGSGTTTLKLASQFQHWPHRPNAADPRR